MELYGKKVKLRAIEENDIEILLKEDVRRQTIYKNGEYHDLIMIGILKEDYMNRVEETGYWEESTKNTDNFSGVPCNSIFRFAAPQSAEGGAGHEH